MEHDLRELLDRFRDTVREDLRDMREEVRGDIVDLRQRVDTMDQRINGRIGRTEKAVEDLRDDLDNVHKNVMAEKVVAARAQGAAEERAAHGLPTSPLPPPVTATEHDQGSKALKDLVLFVGAIGTLAAGSGALITALHAFGVHP